MKEMKTTSFAWVVIVSFTVAPAVVFAIPINWAFNNAVFDDGGMATGSFIYDADTNIHSNISITTSAGSSFVGSTYFTHLSTFSAAGFLGPVDSIAADLGAAGAHSMSLFFVGGLGNAGGTVSLLILAPSPSGNINGSRENLCDLGWIKNRSPSPTSRAGSNGIRGFVQGTVVGTMVPEPAGLALFSLGVFVLSLSTGGAKPRSGTTNGGSVLLHRR